MLALVLYPARPRGQRSGAKTMPQTDVPARSASSPAACGTAGAGPPHTSPSSSSPSAAAVTAAAAATAATAAKTPGAVRRAGTGTRRRARLSVRQSISMRIEQDRGGSGMPDPGATKRALIIFGMQQDFFGDLPRPARLPVPGASRCATKVAQLLDLSFDAIIWVRTCHPINHCSFVENNPGAAVGSFEVVRNGRVTGQAATGTRQSTRAGGRIPRNIAHLPSRTSSASGRSRSIMQQVVRPAHCIEGTRGAAFHPDVRPSPRDRILKACTDPLSKSPGVPDELLTELLNMGSRLGEVYVCGIGVAPFVDVLVDRLMSSHAAHHRNNGTTFFTESSGWRGPKRNTTEHIVSSPGENHSREPTRSSSPLQPATLAVYALEDICFALNMSERSSGKSEPVEAASFNCVQHAPQMMTNRDSHTLTCIRIVDDMNRVFCLQQRITQLVAEKCCQQTAKPSG